MTHNRKQLFAITILLSLACFSTLGCGGGASETIVPEEAASVEAPTDNPAQEPDMSDGP